MRPAQKTSPVKKRRGGGPIPRPRQQKKQVLGAFGERVPEVKGGRPPPKGSSAVKQRKLSPAALKSKRLKEKESLNKYAESLPLKKRGRDNKLLSKAEALRERRLRAAAERQKRLKEKKATPIKPENLIDKTPRGGVDPRLTARRKRAAALRRRREAAAANKANRSAVRTDNKQAASDLAKFNAARKRQAKKATPTATPTARRTAKPVGDRRVPVSRRVPFRDTGKPPTARRTAKVVNDRRFPVSRRVRRR